ncbi:MAG: MBL fold metallo-hydrolase [Chloroflexota bacterium]
MKLTVVGSAPAYTSRPGHASSCYLVEHGSTAIVLDFGQGAFSELWRYLSPAEVSAIVISHMHADHNVDLIPLRHWVRYENRGYGPALFGPRELRQRFGEFQADPEFLADLRGESLDSSSITVGDVRLETARVTHIPDSFAIRVSPADGKGPGLVYSGDCGVADDLLPLIRSGDTLLCEAAFGTQREVPGIHLTAAEAASVADRRSAERLILTHVQDRHDVQLVREAAESIFDGQVAVAEPAMVIPIA